MNRNWTLALAIGLSCLVTACSHAATEDSGATAAALTAPTPPAASEHCNGNDIVPDSPTRETITLGESPTRGPVDAPVTLVVFSDFECPYCKKSEATIHALEAAYPNKVRVVFKNVPLPMHEHARLAAKAALAASEQGKFWEYHDALFGQQDALDRPSLEETARRLGLDVPRFRASLDSAKLDAALEADLAEAHRLNVEGTPSFFVNGRNVKGAQPIATFKTKIDEALAER